MAIHLQIRRGTAAEWSSANPLLMAGELGFETDTGKFKAGNGATLWNSLPYSIGSQGATGPAGGTGGTGAAGGTGGTGGPGPASAVSFGPTGGIVSTNVQAAIVELAGDLPNLHTDDSHEDLTRYLWMSAGAGGVTTGSNLVNTTSGPVYQYPDGVTETVSVDFALPNDWISDFGMTIYWIPSATVTGAVRWSSNITYVQISGNTTVAGTTALFTGVGGAKNVNILIAEAEQVLPQPTAGSIVRFSLSRIGGDVTFDTYSGIVQLVGIKFSYTANQ